MPKYQLVEMSDLRNSGKRRVYPKLVTNRTMSFSDLLDKMKLYNRGLSPTVVEAAVTDVRDMLGEMLSMGYNVNIDGLGTFSLSLDFEDDKPTEMQSDDDKMICLSQQHQPYCRLLGVEEGLRRGGFTYPSSRAA